ncbi:hypothetical protein M0805_005852 [Coniferiporia weirii]|nr:hypothetical protein M0805_005852 [Coniferiporia weirii]
MPFTLARLRLGRSPTPTEGRQKGRGAGEPKDDASISSGRHASTRVSRSRFSFSWFKKRTRSETYDALPPHPPTPTPFLISRVAASAVAKEIKSVKKPQDVRPRSMYSLVPASISKPGANELDTGTTGLEGAVHEDEDDDDEDDEMTDAERTHLNSFAHGLRGLIAELQRADEEARLLPPTKNTDGIPLSPIIEAEELDFEPEQDSSFDSDLDERVLEEGLRTPCPTAPNFLTTPSQFDHEESHMQASARSKVMVPLATEKLLLGGPEHVNDDPYDSITIAEKPRVDEIASLALQGESPGETEDDQEYYSADPGLSPPASSSEDEDDDGDNDSISESGFALRLLGLDLARPSTPFGFVGSSGVLNGNCEGAEDGYEEDEETDHETSPATSRVQPHLQLRTRAITLASATEQLPPASRAPLLPLTLPIPHSHTKIQEEGTNEAQNVEELMRTVTRLQREKARLQRALAGAERRIEEQSVELVSLTNQIVTLRAAVRRLAAIDTDRVSFASDNGADSSVSIFPSAACGTQYIDGEGHVPADAELGSVQSPLSTPPATPDRQTASVLVEGVPGPRLPVPVTTTGRKRGLVRRKSAGASSSLRFSGAEPDVRELGIGRAQIKRRVGSVDLKSANTAWS